MSCTDCSLGPASYQPRETLGNFINFLEPPSLTPKSGENTAPPHRVAKGQEPILHEKWLELCRALGGPPSVSSYSCDLAGVLHLGRAKGISDSSPLAPTGLMGTNTVEQLLENVCLLLASRTRDVVKSALGFIKVAVIVMDVAHLAKHVQLVVSASLPLGRWQHAL